jgi:hypothetical protein
VKPFVAVLVCVFSYWSALFANDVQKKSLKALKEIRSQIKIDGHLSEDCWQKSMHQGDFIQVEPVVGIPASFSSEVSVIYDDHAIYIGAILYDKDPKKILKELSIRDNLANADNFSVFFDPYNSGLNGFLFQVTASGVQLDAIMCQTMMKTTTGMQSGAAKYRLTKITGRLS